MYDPYKQLIDELHARRVETYFQRPDQLVISLQRGVVMPFSGNSFWVTCRNGIWYLNTWVPTCYRVPIDVSVVDLCVEFVECGQQAQPSVMTSLAERYRLTELSENEAATILTG